MGITFDQSSNSITITGYTEASPCTFDDIYNEDVGATNGRLLLDGTIDADPDTFTLDEQPSPMDYLAIPLKIVCTARAGAECEIQGTDAWGRSIGGNRARLVGTAEASSEYNATYSADKAIDGNTGTDWASAGEGAGAWWKVTFDKREVIDRVVVRDRPNLNDDIAELQLEFEDGSTVNYTMPTSADDGTPQTITFTPRYTKWIKVNIISVRTGTKNIGLMEFEAYSPRLDISSGSATTDCEFKTVDSITVYGLQNGDNFDIYQDRWGILWKNEDTYIVNAYIYVGDGTTASYLAAERKLIDFPSPYFFQVKNNGNLRFGVEGTDAGRSGCSIIFRRNTSDWWASLSGSNLDLFHTQIMNLGGKAILFQNGTAGKWYDVLYDGGYIKIYAPNITIKRLSAVNVAWFIVGCEFNTVPENVYVRNSSWALVPADASKVVMRGLEWSGITNNNAINNIKVTNAYIIDGTPFVASQCGWSYGTGRDLHIWQQKSVNIKVIDKNGDPIQNATVKITDNFGTSQSELTDANGMHPEILATVYDIHHLTDNSVVETDYNPFTIEISKNGYETYTEVLDIDSKVEWIVTLYPPGHTTGGSLKKYGRVVSRR